MDGRRLFMSISIPSSTPDASSGTPSADLQALAQAARGLEKKPVRTRGLIDFASLIPTSGSAKVVAAKSASRGALMANPALDGSTPPQAQATAPASTIQVPDACAQSMVTLGGQIDGHISEVAQMVQGPVEGNTAGSDSSESAVGVDVSGTAANEGTGLVSSALGMSLGYPPASKRPNGVPGLSGSSLNADSVSPSLAHPTEGVDRASGSLAASTTGSTDSPGGAQMEQLHTMYASTVASSSAQAEVEIASLTGTAAAKSADRADRKSGVSKSNGIGAIKIEQVNEEKGDTKLEMAVGIPSANPGRTMVSSDPHSAFAKGSALDAEPVVGVRVVVAQPENAPLTGSVGHDVSDSHAGG